MNLPRLVGLGDASSGSAFKVYRQDQPYGEDGIKFSLEQVAKRIAEGRLHPEVRAWGTRRLAAVGNPKGPIARARALRDAVMGNMKNGRWAPDPTDAEFMPAAHMMLEKCKDGAIGEDGSCTLGELPATFALGDCDDLSIHLGSVLFLAATGNVGVYGAIVGHAYDSDKIIEHVLCAVWGDNRWWYCDPSMPNLKFGECKPYTRERAIYIPSMELACDADVCLAPGGRASGPPPAPTRGDFVGLAGEPEFPPDARAFRFRASDKRGIGLGNPSEIVTHEERLWADAHRKMGM